MQEQAFLSKPRGSFPGTWKHLASRLFDVLRSRGLTEAEKDQVRDWLHPSEEQLFFSQQVFDQRHGFESARYVAASTSRLDLIRSALLHDVGKRQAHMGPIARSVASAWAKVGGKAGGRWGEYLDHGRVAAAELSDLGAETLVVDFAMNHHGQRPPSISPEDWELLQHADRARG